MRVRERFASVHRDVRFSAMSLKIAGKVKTENFVANGLSIR